MKNPFPGMNPYLEMRWHDVHTSLMVYIRDALNPRLPAGLVARVEEEIRVDLDQGKPEKRYRPDVEVSARKGPSRQDRSAVAVMEEEDQSTDPFFILTREPPTPRHVEILDTRDWRVVTAIELLSPSNKVSVKGREAYEAKQRAYTNAGVNLVEIDLVRDGHYVLAAPLEDIPPSKRASYMVCVYRASDPFRWAVYPAALRERLPNISIPLRPTDPDIVLSLQRLIDETCERSYDDYHATVEPALSPDDAAWAGGILRAAGVGE